MFYSFNKAALLINIRATVKASDNSIRDVKNGELLINVTAAPENNKANAAIIELLSKKIGVPKSSMTITFGGKCRNKRVSIDLSDRKVSEISAIKKILGNLQNMYVSKTNSS